MTHDVTDEERESYGLNEPELMITGAYTELSEDESIRAIFYKTVNLNVDTLSDETVHGKLKIALSILTVLMSTK